MFGSPYGCDLFWSEDPMPVLPLRFKYDCEGTIAAIQRACEPRPEEDPSNVLTLSIPYYGVPVERAVWFARYLFRQAVKLGLYPTVAQLEAETRKAA